MGGQKKSYKGSEAKKERQETTNEKNMAKIS